MKASELILKLKEIIESQGDLTVKVYTSCGCCGGFACLGDSGVTFGPAESILPSEPTINLGYGYLPYVKYT